MTLLPISQCDIVKCNQSESEHSASLDSESSDSNESTSYYVHYHLPHPRCHLPSSLQLSLVQVGASGEQVVGGGQGDSDHPPAHSHVRVARDGASGTGGALDTPSSWHGGSVGVGYLHLEGDGWISCSSFSTTSRHDVAVDDMSHESCSNTSSSRSMPSPRDMPSRHRALRQLVKPLP